MTDDASTPAGAGKRGRGWRKEIPDEIRALAREGFSRAEIAAELELPLETFDRWEAGMKVFREAMAQARTLSLAWWERKGREGIESGKLNATLWGKNMAGRFPELYGERAAVEAARKAAAKPVRPRRPVTDFERAKIVAALITEHPAAFAHLLPPAPLALAAGPSSSDS